MENHPVDHSASAAYHGGHRDRVVGAERHRWGGADTEPAGGSGPLSAPTAMVPISTPTSAPAAAADRNDTLVTLELPADGDAAGGAL